MPEDLAPVVRTRVALHRVATHLLARRRHAVTGRFGLRATPGGFGTPAFGPPEDLEVVRVSGLHLVHERGEHVQVVPLAGATLAQLAEVVGVDLAAAFSTGGDTVDLGPVDEPLEGDAAAARLLADWLDLGWRALDRIALEARCPAPIQLWPEHFDASCLVFVGAGENDRCDVGVSLGDAHHEEPYLYLSPWSDARPGDAAFWSAPFGALLPRREVHSVEGALAFFREGLSRLT